MAVYSIYFSPTGGTQKVMECLTSAWETVKTVDLADPQADFSALHFCADDLCLLGVPSYEGRVPPLALKRIQELKADKTPCVLVTVFGNRDFNDTLLELKDTALTVGFAPYAAVSAVAQHSILPMIASGRPDADDTAELRAFSVKLKEAAGTKNADVSVPGKKPYIVIPVAPTYPQFDADKCVHCMICAQQCPAQAIDSEDPSRIDTSLCARCMRCTVVCPTQARYIDPQRQQLIVAKLAKRFEGRKPNALYL